MRHIEGGMRPFEAALKGSREIGFTIVSITFSLIAVFIPVLLMGGMVGRVFREFAVSISVAIIVSGFVSLTLTPMLCARVLKSHHGDEKQNFVLRWFERVFEWMLQHLRMDARPGARVQVDHVDGHARHVRRQRSALCHGAQRVSFRQEDTGYMIGITEGRDRYRVSGDGRASAQGCRNRACRSSGCNM